MRHVPLDHGSLGVQPGIAQQTVACLEQCTYPRRAGPRACNVDQGQPASVQQRFNRAEQGALS
ncbi:hypothetical protein BXU03_23375 [Xanthomonas oryzae pv. oryzae]|nr:hypothetical protein BXU03_23375 [Xanthomonas oryzae pv. oryzae]OLI45344.1 hypothetical protein IXO141_03225 [Xanthomonas oryzae pv. oryzae]OLI93589.1 hypothetical protein IXO390_10515 [Xanthomonas oryzae pv. oryzae]